MILELLLIFGSLVYIIGCHLLVDDIVYENYYIYFIISELTAATIAFGIISILFGEWLFYDF